MANSKDELREKLAQDMAEFRGEVVRYAAIPPPERRPWKRRPSLTDEAYQGSPQNSEKIVRYGCPGNRSGLNFPSSSLRLCRQT